MLNPNNDRLDYGQVLAPPDKYRLDFAIGTTYSLDLDALVGACIALGLSEETDSDLMKNPICLLEALRTTGDKVALFCEGGQIHTPNSVTPLYILLEKMVFQVNTAKRRGIAKFPSFHPKFWLLRYIDEQNNPLYRVVVLSRNLTFDRSWDITFCMDGKVNGRKTLKTSPVGDFLSYLVGQLPADENAKAKQKKIRAIAGQLDEIEKRIMAGLKDFQRATVNRIDELYRAGQMRVLVSDEVGLGKTLIARGTIAKLAKLQKESGDKLVKVVYVCSNASIAEQNLNKLRITSELKTESTSSSRLSMQHLNIFRQENDTALLNRYIQLIQKQQERQQRIEEISRTVPVVNTRNGKKKNYPKENIAFKCNYCDGGKDQNGIGYLCACSDELIGYNIEVAQHSWCCNEEAPCSQYYDGIIDRETLDEQNDDGGFVCYESQMLRNWAAFAGFVLTGENKQKPMKLSKVQINSLAILTSREPYAPEKDRFVFGVFLVDEAYEGDNRDEGYVTTSSKYKISLTQKEAKKILFWNYYHNENSPEKVAWGQGLHRYITDIQAASVLYDIWKVKAGTKDEELAKEFLDHFCKINAIKFDDLPVLEGALTR